ncbi:8980_t:CDS:10 [Paraglomus occultum]|uniref:Calcium-channel protein CCH1 n=1 Tax=Paraglomus occultum TaxID=144539 RepID=A0A9N9G553_9GLOM|nr:8980_t:CDS:10 [Paraglomus occultum]
MEDGDGSQLESDSRFISINNTNVNDSLPDDPTQETLLDSSGLTRRHSPMSSSRVTFSEESTERVPLTGRSRTLRPASTQRPSMSSIRTWNSSDFLFSDGERLSRNASEDLTRVPSFLDRRQLSYSSGDDVVEMSHVGQGSSSTGNGLSKTRTKSKKDSKEPLDRLHPRIASLKQTRSLNRMSQMLARVSSRVVNIANVPRVQQEKEEMDTMQTPLPPRTSSRKHLEELYAKRNGAEGMRDFSSDLYTKVSDKLKATYTLSPEIRLEDRSLYIFGPKNSIRLWLHGVLINPWTESIILLLIVTNLILLSIQAWTPVETPEAAWGKSWIDYALLAIFTIFTFEIIARVIVSGFIINPKQSSKSISADSSSNKLNESTTETRYISNAAFLRHSFNRIDLLAVTSFWIDLTLNLMGVHDVRIWKALSTLRSLRLLSVTSGSSTILESLKKSVPLLVNVTFFVGFFFVLFSIIAVQSFKGSLLRRCVVSDTNSTLDNQLCGGYYENGEQHPYIRLDGSEGAIKGFICPSGQICKEVENPSNGTVSFDNIFTSMVIVFVISSVQNWTDIMYQTMDSDFDWSCLFFIVAVIVLNFWLINLFVAVVTTMFAKIREDSSHSAFTLSKTAPILADDDEEWTLQEGAQKTVRVNKLMRIVEETKYVWVLAILVDLIIMGFRSANMSPETERFLSNTELAFTIAFAIEIIIRFAAYLPDWRLFFRKKKNVVDLTLAVVTCLIQVPLIKNSIAFPYLTAFQIARAYRIVIAIPRMRALLTKVLGSAIGLANLIFFIVLIDFIAAIIGVQLLRGNIPSQDENGNDILVRFSDIYNGFVGMYQLFSGENWTTVLYNAMQYENRTISAAAVAIFLIVWVSLSNFVLLNMFIAVVQENFEIAEEEKRKRQLRAFIRKADPIVKTETVINKWNPYRFFKAKPKTLAVASIPSGLILHTQKSRVRDFMHDSDMDKQNKFKDEPIKRRFNVMRKLKRWFRVDEDDEEHVPLTAYMARRHSSIDDTNNGTIVASEPGKSLEISRDDIHERHAQKVDFISAHPNYDAALWFISPRNRIRHYCQLLVPPSFGERTFGTRQSHTLSLVFSSFIYSCIIASVVVACITNPAYQKQYYIDYIRPGTWFWITDVVFTGIFTFEFLVKIIADGFLLTPNAYLLNVWNMLDFFVLITLYISTFAVLLKATVLSRAIRAFKALRALRLINLSSRVKETFNSILIAGAPRIFDASFVSISLIIPFALYGQNIFSGLLFYCNDNGDNIAGKDDCFGEYSTSPYNLDTQMLTPRVWSNPYVWSFDTFRAGLLILFEIVSGEGWIDVMASTMSITGLNQQPRQDATKWNAVFFMVFNMAGAVFVLTLFISVIIENFMSRSGFAFLTADQKRWMDLKKLLKQIRPSKRPKIRPTNKLRGFCYDQVIVKKGWLSKFMTITYILHIITLMTEFRAAPPWLETLRKILFLVFIAIYILDICIKLAGFGWTTFRRNRWNLYDLFIVFGAATTTIPFSFQTRVDDTVVQLQKLFLVGIAFKIVQKSDSLNQLFKNMAASLPSIFNLFAVWFVIFCIYAIMFMEIFGLTKFGQNGSPHVNFRNFWNAMLTLVRMSTGEGWNQIMHDFAVEPPDCVDNKSYLLSDCGSEPWAYFLFITWNVLSMYIFANMFIVVVIDNFSYCYQIAAEFSLVNREQIRQFKKAWAEIDRNRTGYIKSQDFAKFFGKLSGIFEVKIYEDQHQIKSLIDRSKAESLWGSSRQKGVYNIDRIDIRKLKQNIAMINMAKVRERRRTYSHLYNEALLSVERDSRDNEKGISFTNMLLMLAHYKLVDDDQSLEIDELLKRKEKMERVADAVNRDRVKSLLKAIYWYRKHQIMKAKMTETIEAVPEITVELSDKPSQTLRIHTSSARSSQMTLPMSPGTPNSPVFDADQDLSTRASAELRRSYVSDDIDSESVEWASFDANHEMNDQTAEEVLNSLQNNFWHDVLKEMSEEDSQSKS